MYPRAIKPLLFASPTCICVCILVFTGIMASQQEVKGTQVSGTPEVQTPGAPGAPGNPAGQTDQCTPVLDVTKPDFFDKVGTMAEAFRTRMSAAIRDEGTLDKLVADYVSKLMQGSGAPMTASAAASGIPATASGIQATTTMGTGTMAGISGQPAVMVKAPPADIHGTPGPVIFKPAPTTYATPIPSTPVQGTTYMSPEEFLEYRRYLSGKGTTMADVFAPPQHVPAAVPTGKGDSDREIFGINRDQELVQALTRARDL